MLDRNERVVRAEAARYGGGSPADVEGLRAADRELEQRAAAVRRLQAALDNLEGGPAARRNRRRGMGIANYTMRNLRRMAPVAEELAVRRSEYEQARMGHGLRHPVLLATGYRPGTYAAGSPRQAARRTAGPLREVLDNIREVREEILDDDLKVWDINRAIATAMVEMGIAGSPEMTRAVQRHIRRRQADEAFKQLAIAALAIGSTLLSGPLAPVVGAAWAVGFAAGGIDRYSLQLAANNVALDPEVRDISANEPSLLWLVVDIAGAAIDLGAVLRALRPVARAALASGTIAEFSATARRLVPDVADQLVMRLRQRLDRRAAAPAEAGTVGGPAPRAAGAAPSTAPGPHPRVASGVAEDPSPLLRGGTLSERHRALLTRVAAADDLGVGMAVVGRREVTATDLAAFTRHTGNEFALVIFRDNRRVLIDVGSYRGGALPANTRTLLMHSHPHDFGTGMARLISAEDVAALLLLNQRYSYMVTVDGTVYRFTGRTAPLTEGELVRRFHPMLGWVRQ